jgi:hypothetical protein
MMPGLSHQAQDALGAPLPVYLNSMVIRGAEPDSALELATGAGVAERTLAVAARENPHVRGVPLM